MDETQIKKLLSDFESRIKDQEDRFKKMFAQFQDLIRDQLDIIVKQQRTMQVSIDRLDRDLGEDRKDISDIKMRQGKIDYQMDEIRSLFGQQTQKIKETVQDVVHDNVSQVLQQGEQIKEIISEEVNT